MLKLLLIIFTIISIGLPSPSDSAEIRISECDQLNPEPKIIFKTSYGQLIHDLSTSQRDIQALSTRQEKGILVDGLATAETQGLVRINKAQGIKISNKSYCILAQEIEIYFGYLNPTIYIAKEHPLDSCRFSLLIRHEQTHQRINILSMQYFLPLLQNAATQIIKNSPTVMVNNTEDAHAALVDLQNYYIFMLLPLIERFNQAREQEHQKLDNQTNYAMESSICAVFDSQQK